MAITREIWIQAITEGLFASDSFLSKAKNLDEYVVGGKVVHVPQAGAPSSVSKNRSSKPATVNSRTDTDLTFNLDEFTTDPVLISNAETVELSYNKRESVLHQDKMKLRNAVSESILYQWTPAAANTLSTTGSSVAAHTKSATGNRKAVSKADVLALMTRFNEQDIPQEERYLLLDAKMYSQLLNDLTANENTAFLASADAQKGILGKLYSFNVMMRSKVALYDKDKAKKEWSADGATTDLAAGLAWHVDSVGRALGEVQAYESEKNPTYYGDIYSFLLRAGGSPMRSDVKGLTALVQASVA